MGGNPFFVDALLKVTAGPFNVMPYMGGNTHPDAIIVLYAYERNGGLGAHYVSFMNYGTNYYVAYNDWSFEGVTDIKDIISKANSGNNRLLYIWGIYY